MISQRRKVECTFKDILSNLSKDELEVINRHVESMNLENETQKFFLKLKNITYENAEELLQNGAIIYPNFLTSMDILTVAMLKNPNFVEKQKTIRLNLKKMLSRMMQEEEKEEKICELGCLTQEYVVSLCVIEEESLKIVTKYFLDKGRKNHELERMV